MGFRYNNHSELPIRNLIVERRRQRAGGIYRLAFWTIFGLVLILFLSRVFAPDNNSRSLVNSFNFPDKWSFNFEDKSLTPQIKNFLKDKKGSYAVYIESLEPATEQIVKINSSEGFPAGSLYKLFLVAAVLEAVERGEIKEDQTMTASVSHLEEVVGAEFGYEEYEGEEISYTVAEALTRVATISDNYAAIMLAETVGWEKVRVQAQVIGAVDTSIKDPITTTAYDVGLFLKKLYFKQIVSEQVSLKIIDLLASSRLNNRIPALLPKELKIAHKTGELAGVRHDAGIVFLEGKPYVIVMMSKDLKFENDGVENLAQVSKMAYDYVKTGEK